MKKAFFILLAAASFTMSAQTSNKEIEISIEFYDALQIIKNNPHFSFIDKHSKMLETTNDKTGTKRYSVVGADYKVEMKSQDEFYIISEKGAGRYYISLFKNSLIGHGYVDDNALNRLLTYYFQDNEVVKESVIKLKKKK